MVRHEIRLRARVFVRGVRGLPCGLRVDRFGPGRRCRFVEPPRCFGRVRRRSQGCLEHHRRCGGDRRRRRLGEPGRCERERCRSSSSSGQGSVLPRRAVRSRKDVRGHGARGLLPRMHRGYLQRRRRRSVQLRHVQCFVCERRGLSVRASLQYERHLHLEELQRHCPLRRDPRVRRRLLSANQMHRRDALSRRHAMPEHSERRALRGVVSHLSVSRPRGATSDGHASRERTVLGTADAGRGRKK